MNDCKENIKVPNEIVSLYEEYNDIKVPYFRSRKSLQLRKRVFKGKGSFTEIQNEISKLQKNNQSNESIQLLLVKNNIGIDCSGFISHLYNAYTMVKYKKPIWNFFSRPSTNPFQLLLFKIQPIVSKLNAATLTSDLNTKTIQKVKDIRPLDLIKFSGGRHVGLIYQIFQNGGKVERIDYIHATEGTGITKNTIRIIDEEKNIFAQEWEGKTKGAKYEPEYLMRYTINKNGIRRPNFLIS